MPLALLALAVGAFGIGLTEFVIVGLMSGISHDLEVSIPTAGLLVSGYAAGVVVGAPLLTAAGTKAPRKTMLLTLMGIFVAGNLISALAPSYGLLMAGRVVASLTHGAFFGVGSVVAAGLVPEEKRARAVALMFAGLTLANVLGVPMGTALGQQLGWRSTFWAVTVIGLLALALIAALVPHQPADPSATLRGELKAFRNVQVWLALLVTALGFAAFFGIVTYVEPMMTTVAGFPTGAVPWLLVLFGSGLVVGNYVGGKAADRRLMPTLYTVLAGMAVLLVVFAHTLHSPVPAPVTLFVFGAVGFAITPTIQTRVMDEAVQAPALASAVNIAAFNLGNAVTAWVNGAAIDSGAGYTAPAWIGAVFAGAGLAAALLSGGLDRRRRKAVRVRPEAATGAEVGTGADPAPVLERC
ncbi:DHA1 family inner membrane transport protein [Haloactinospora alba]|uniref:DHA1 family inner membrane transport protein n=1 Tax=Haloactinospora alba TaxID=405555 RepID=A0A543NND8_9ACTN|nr:MFS transporter [Haloactinospora alba]TQN33351.1 DHA1 family inner membrane transport protein [Haloactinospora alba]